MLTWIMLAVWVGCFLGAAAILFHWISSAPAFELDRSRADAVPRERRYVGRGGRATGRAATLGIVLVGVGGLAFWAWLYLLTR